MYVLTPGCLGHASMSAVVGQHPTTAKSTPPFLSAQDKGHGRRGLPCTGGGTGAGSRGHRRMWPTIGGFYPPPMNTCWLHVHLQVTEKDTEVLSWPYPREAVTVPSAPLYRHCSWGSDVELSGPQTSHSLTLRVPCLWFVTQSHAGLSITCRTVVAVM